MPGRFSVREALVNGVLGILGALILLFASGAWGSKENVAAHDTDISAIRRAMIDLAAGQQRILDALCDPQKAKPRACTSLTTGELKP